MHGAVVAHERDVDAGRLECPRVGLALVAQRIELGVITSVRGSPAKVVAVSRSLSATRSHPAVSAVCERKLSKPAA